MLLHRCSGRIYQPHIIQLYHHIKSYHATYQQHGRDVMNGKEYGMKQQYDMNKQQEKEHDINIQLDKQQHIMHSQDMLAIPAALCIILPPYDGQLHIIYQPRQQPSGKCQFIPTTTTTTGPVPPTTA